MTIAERFFDLLGDDGMQERTRLGVDRVALADRIGRRFDVKQDYGSGAEVGWRFADGSEIIECGGAWATPDDWAVNS